jgi:hypothetical protein
MVGTPAHIPPTDHTVQLARLIAEDRRGDAVRFYMKDIIGMPGLLVTLFRILPMWSKLKAVAPSLPYDSAIMGDFSLPAERAADVIPGARLRTLPGQTHNVAAAALAPVLKEFFAP